MAQILLADDQADVRTVLSRSLQIDGHRVTKVADGDAAFEALQGGPFDLLLTDLVMPRLDGIALAVKVTKEWPRMRVVIMTGYPNPQSRARNIEALVDDIVVKPFSAVDIRNLVHDVMSRPEDSRDRPRAE